MPGYFVISLDFEMIWGMIEKSQNELIKKRVQNVEIVIPKILEVFKTHDIHATWGVVGILMLNDFEELKSLVDKIDFKYEKKELRISKYLSTFSDSEFDSNIHFKYDLIKNIKETPYQEIASHSFSHFYGNELGQTISDFESDILLFNKVALNKLNLKPVTYIHPRFQNNKDYNRILTANGYKIIRGLREDKLKNSSYKDKTRIKIKYYDRYLNLLGHRSYSLNDVVSKKQNDLYDIKESYYLRPYNARTRIFEFFKLKRIKNEMTYAAKNNKIFHLWWHPHDFGIDIEKNLTILDKIARHYVKLNKRFNYLSKNMVDLLDIILSKE